jgi:cyclophilin family peptidyl-prolyl cis-trans isomerase
MPQSTHKSATSVTLAPIAEKAPFERFVAKYWVHGLVGAGVISAIIVYRVSGAQQEKETRHESWDRLTTAATPVGFPQIPHAEARVFDGLATELKDRPVAPWARWLEANEYAKEHKFAEAKAALGKLSAEHPNHALVTTKLNFGGSGPESAVVYLGRSLDARAAWEQQHPNLFANPPIPADAVRVKVSTSAGDIVLALYPSSAPQLVAGFLAHVDAKDFDGTKFHHVDPQLGVDGGDPNTKQDDVALWGQGGKDQFVPYIDSGLFHFAGAISSASGASKNESLTTQFTLLTGDRHELDGTRVVFGVIESGLDVVKTIGSAEVDDTSLGRPKQPVVVATMARL